MKKRLIFITGVPGVGKTTVLLKTVEGLKALGYSVGGMISREVREGAARVGFEVLDLATGKSGWLAHVNQKTGPKVGKYGVNLEDLNRVGVSAILYAIENCDVVAIDEVGPMELYSEKFKIAVWKAVESRKPVIGTVHWKAKDKLIDTVKTREDAEIFTVTHENRDRLHQSIIERIKKLHVKTGSTKLIGEKQTTN